MRLEVLLFDWDGTLVNSKACITVSIRLAFQECLDMDVHWTEEQFLHAITLRTDELFAPYGTGVARAAAQAYQRAYERLSPQMVHLYDGADRALSALKDGGVRLAVVTNKARDRFEQDARRFGITGYFETVVTAEDTVERKPDPSPVILALERLGVEPVKSVFVGDNPCDVVAGRQAGAKAGAALWGFYPRDRLLRLNPDFAFETLWDCLQCLG